MRRASGGNTVLGQVSASARNAHREGGPYGALAPGLYRAAMQTHALSHQG